MTNTKQPMDEELQANIDAILEDHRYVIGSLTYGLDSSNDRNSGTLKTAIMQLITQYSDRRELEGRIDELVQLRETDKFFFNAEYAGAILIHERLAELNKTKEEA